MAKLLVAAVAISTLGYMAYVAMYKTKVDNVEDRVAHAPKRQLDNVREAAKGFEAADQQRMTTSRRRWKRPDPTRGAAPAGTASATQSLPRARPARAAR